MMKPGSRAIAFRIARLSLAIAAVAAALIWPVAPAKADLTTYFGIDQGDGNPPTTPVVSLAARNSFLAGLSGVGVENFESQVLNAFPSTLHFTGTSVTAASSTTDSTDNYVTTGTTYGTFATSGTHYLFDNGSSSLGVNYTLNLSAPVAGFGMYVTDLSDGITPADQIEYKLTFSDNATQTVETNVGTNNNNANVLFFGVISTNPAETITSIQILNTVTNQGDAIGFDDFTIGLVAVPEPTSLVLSALGLLGLAVGCRHRGRKAPRTA